MHICRYYIDLGCCVQRTVVCHNAKPPRGDVAQGVIIDDHCIGEKFISTSLDNEGYPVPNTTPPPHSVGHAIFSKTPATYSKAHVAFNPTKSASYQMAAAFWGASFDGVREMVRAPLFRIMALALLCCDVARLGVATVGMLSAIAGSFVSVFIFWRRLMCNLERSFWATGG